MNQPARSENEVGFEGEDLVLQATRSWVWAIMADACGTARSRYVRMWEDSFELIGSREAARIWSSFMRLLSLEGNAKFLIGCGGCGRPSIDERALLRCLAAHQAGQKREAAHLLEHWFDGESLWKADALAEAFADQLSLKGFHMAYGLDDGRVASVEGRYAGPQRRVLN